MNLGILQKIGEIINKPEILTVIDDADKSRVVTVFAALFYFHWIFRDQKTAFPLDDTPKSRRDEKQEISAYSTSRC